MTPGTLLVRFPAHSDDYFKSPYHPLLLSEYSDAMKATTRLSTAAVPIGLSCVHLVYILGQVDDLMVARRAGALHGLAHRVLAVIAL